MLAAVLTATLAAMNPKPLMTAGILAAGIAVAACSGSPSAAPASAGGDTSLIAYASCMRSHGVPGFPDPASSGGIPKETAQQLGVGQSQFAAASSACAHVLPAGESLGGQVSQPVTAQQQQYYLKAAACMRSHGITNFPEPSFQGGEVEFPGLEHLVDINSPQFVQADRVCGKLIPPGLPYSGQAG
jgi:hypothetical protein